MSLAQIDADHDGVMDTLSIANVRRPLNTWQNSYISPGPVSSVGDALVGVRLKHSAPNLPLRWDPRFSKANEPRLGSNVTDGLQGNYITNAGPPTLVDSNWQDNRHFKVCHGWVYQDLRATDRLAQPVVGETPDYSWNNKLATNYNSRHTGELFLPSPGPYQLGAGELPRGGKLPRITDIVNENLYGELQAVKGTVAEGAPYGYGYTPTGGGLFPIAGGGGGGGGVGRHRPMDAAARRVLRG